MVEQLSLKKEIRVPLRALDSGNHGPELSPKASLRPSWPSRLLAEPAARIFLGAGGLGPSPGLFRPSWPFKGPREGLGP